MLYDERCFSMVKTYFKDALVGKSPFAKRVIVALGLCALGSGCVSLENEEGRLPDAMRGAIAGLTAKGYPDLTKIPDPPTDLPSSTTWTALETGLIAQGLDLSANPTAAAPTAEETNLDWAQSEKEKLEADPRAAALPAVVPGAEGTPEWAAAARAKLEADLARLPPP
jgi:hypothetical protein